MTAQHPADSCCLSLRLPVAETHPLTHGQSPVFPHRLSASSPSNNSSSIHDDDDTLGDSTTTMSHRGAVGPPAGAEPPDATMMGPPPFANLNGTTNVKQHGGYTYEQLNEKYSKLKRRYFDLEQVRSFETLLLRVCVDFSCVWYRNKKRR